MSGRFSPLVSMVEAADPRQAYYPGRCGWTWCDQTTRRGVLAKEEVASILVVVTDVVANESNQVEIVQDDNMIQQLSPAGADPALRDAVLPRASR